MDIFNLKVLLISFLIFVPLELLIPLHRDQKLFRAGWLNDAIYATVNFALSKAVLLVLVVLAMGALEWLVPVGLKSAIAGQPVWLQVIEIIVIADVGLYFAHRAFHAVPFLWRFHAIHHSIEELDWIAAHRTHPIDLILTKAASLIPVAMLGFDVAALGIFAVIVNGQALLLHANVRMNFGLLKWIVASPQFHHWHHGNEPNAYNKNFSAQLSLIDVIFGTFHAPGKELPAKYGIDDPMPRWYLPQLMHPFKNVETPRSEP